MKIRGSSSSSRRRPFSRKRSLPFPPEVEVLKQKAKIEYMMEKRRRLESQWPPHFKTYDNDSTWRRWEELDHELLISIMKRSCERHLLFSICLVCKSWLNAVLDTLFPPQDVLDLCSYSRFLLIPHTSQPRLRNSFWKLIMLHLNRPQQAANYTKLPSIRSVTLRHVGWQKLCGLRVFAASCWKGLVEVNECQGSCVGLLGGLWNQIHTLRLTHRVEVQDAVVIATKFPCLTHLSLRYCGVRDNALSVILESHKNLTSLDISHAQRVEKNVVKDWDEDFLLKASTTITQFIVRCDQMKYCMICCNRFPSL